MTKTKSKTKTNDSKPEWVRWQSCKHAVGAGSIVVDVTPSCRNLHVMHGRLVVAKSECERCKFLEAKE